MFGIYFKTKKQKQLETFRVEARKLLAVAQKCAVERALGQSNQEPYQYFLKFGRAIDGLADVLFEAGVKNLPKLDITRDDLETVLALHHLNVMRITLQRCELASSDDDLRCRLNRMEDLSNAVISVGGMYAANMSFLQWRKLEAINTKYERPPHKCDPRPYEGLNSRHKLESLFLGS